MSELYISYDARYEQTREPYSDDSWDRGDSYTDISLEQISTKKIGESIPSDEDINIGDDVFVVWAHWGSGDTFGHDSGRNAEFYLVTKDEGRANRLVSFLESQTGPNYTGCEFEGFKMFCPWFGYFESLEGIHVEHMIVA